MMVILKLPILYLAGVCYWAVKAEPKPLEGSPGHSPARAGPRWAAATEAAGAQVARRTEPTRRSGGTCDALEAAGVSTAPLEERRSSGAETVAGFLAAISLTASAIAIVYRPLRLAPFAILIALIASALAKERHKRLAAAAVVAASAAWLIGMAIAVLTSNPIY